MKLPGVPRLSRSAWNQEQMADLEDMWKDLRIAFADRLFLNPVPFSQLPSPLGVEGMVADVTDSAGGNIVTGGGSQHVLAWSNGSTWNALSSITPGGSPTFGIINVQDFGAVGNGVTDDIAAIQAAQAALGAGGTLFFPSRSTYRITQPIVIAQSNITILGGDPTAVIQYDGGATTAVITDNGSNSTLYFNNEIRNLTVRGNANVQIGIQIVSQHHSKFLNLRIQNVVSTGMKVLFAVGNQYDVRVSNNDCVGGAYAVRPVVGVDFAGADVNHAATGSEAYLIVESVSGSGIKMGFTDFMVLRGFSESNNRGLEVYNQTENLVVIGMDFESNAVEDVLLNQCYYSQFIGINSSTKFNFNLGRGVALIGGQFKDIVISINAHNPILTGQLLFTGTITDNNFDETVRSPIINYNVGNNTFTPYNRFYGDEVDILNRQGNPTLLRVRLSAAQAGLAAIKVTDIGTNTIYSQMSKFVRVGEDSVGHVDLQPGGSPSNMGSLEFGIGATRYGVLGGGLAATVALTLENGAKFGINNIGVFSRTLFSLSTWNPGLIVNNSQVSTTIALTGSALGDTVVVSLAVDLQGLLLWAYVSTANTITVILRNMTGGDLTLGSTTVRLDVWQH